MAEGVAAKAAVGTGSAGLVAERMAGRRVLVMGLGSFGGAEGAVRFLVGRRANVVVTDKRTKEQLAETVGRLGGLPVQWRLGGHEEADFTAARTDIVVVNPAVPRGSPFLQKARQEGLEITSEMNLFFELCPAAIVGITGSNGKSTTTAMTAGVLRAGADGRARRRYGRVWLGGNIGMENLLAQVEEIAADDLAVLELSSFQLDDLGRVERRPEVAVVTNISPNHLDWHGTMEAYVAAKQNITRGQKRGDYLVLNALEENLTGWAGLSQAAVRWYPAALGSGGGGAAGRPSAAEMEQALAGIELQVPGRHNQINAAAARAVGEIFGVAEAATREALRRYEALPHRLELVRELEGVRYYNDSIATTPESVAAALAAFAGPKILILGGYDKKISFAALAERLVGCGTAPFAALIGQVAGKLADEIEACKARLGKPAPAWARAATLAEAVGWCRAHARAGTAVLLSPACASYDMFRNFQDRGEQFRKLVRDL